MPKMNLLRKALLGQSKAASSLGYYVLSPGPDPVLDGFPGNSDQSILDIFSKMFYPVLNLQIELANLKTL